MCCESWAQKELDRIERLTKLMPNFKINYSVLGSITKFQNCSKIKENKSIYTFLIYLKFC